MVLHLPFLRVLLCLPLLKPFGLPLWLPKALNFIAALLSNQTALFQILKLSVLIEAHLCRCFSAHVLAHNNIQGKCSYITTETVTPGLRMRERRCENGVGNGAHRCFVFVIVVPHGERRFPATSDYGVNGESRAHEDTVSDTAPYTSDLFPV